ncbi:MAG: riboflavin synthase [Acidobacteriota bacterium]|nr:riboflavin synthase [Acidobacteriota bacterium]
MFTGLIESLGHVADVKPTSSGFRVRISTSLAGELALGESVAVNGVCLTVVGTEGDAMDADVAPETARVTTLGSLVAGSTVNLERSMRADGRIGGHFVQGHVDATGSIAEVRPEGESYRLTVAFPAPFGSLIVSKGSIAVDGISLTVASVGHDRFDVQVIPFTWTHTNLSQLKNSAAVNLEFDILGKYVARALEVRR